MTRPSRSLSLFVLFIGVISISFGSIFVRLCDAPPLIIAAYRMLIAAVVLVPLQWKSGEDAPRIQTSKDWIFYLVAGVFLALHFATWITSLKYTSVSSSVVLVNTNPLFVALFSWWFLREKIGIRAIIGVFVAVVGCVLIARADAGIGRNSLRGDVLALIGAMMFSGYLLAGRAVRSRAALTRYIFRVYGVAAAVLVLYCLLTEPNWVHFSGKTYLFFVLSALVPQSIGHTSANWALRFFPAALVAVCILFEPVGASLLALLFFREMLTWGKVLGGLIILTGVYLTLRESRPMEATS